MTAFALPSWFGGDGFSLSLATVQRSNASPFGGSEQVIGPCSAVGDLVRFPHCRATFVVAQRVWTYGPDFEEIQLILEANDTPGLEAVK
jgi:hypothetical protein